MTHAYLRTWLKKTSVSVAVWFWLLTLSNRLSAVMFYWVGFETKGHKKKAAELLVSERLTRGAWWLIPLGHWTRLDHELMAPAWRRAASQKHELDGTKLEGSYGMFQNAEGFLLGLRRWRHATHNVTGEGGVSNPSAVAIRARCPGASSSQRWSVLWSCSAAWGWQTNHGSIHSQVISCYWGKYSFSFGLVCYRSGNSLIAKMWASPIASFQSVVDMFHTMTSELS